MRSFLRTVLVALSTVAIISTGVAPAMGHAHSVTEREDVFGGLKHEKFSIRLSDGNRARGNILRFRQDDEHLELRSTLAQNRVAGFETMPSMAQRERSNDALAGTNGGFGLPRPFGAPNGFAVHGGIVIGANGQTASGFRRPRGTVGMRADGAILLDRLSVTSDSPTTAPRSIVSLRFDGPGGTETVRVDEANLQPRLSGQTNVPTGELIVYDRLFGTGINVPGGSRVLFVEGLRVRPGGWQTGVVTNISSPASNTTVNVPSGTSVVMAHGTAVSRIDTIIPGQPVSVRAQPRPLATSADAWASVRHAVPGGPLLLDAGRRTSDDEWHAEGFSKTGSLVVGRHPRTAIGMTSGGEVMMVTVDGRQPGHSVGMTMRELQRFMEGLGARHAINLDGGGSTTMMIDTRIANRPSESGRSVPNALFVHHTYPFDGTRRISGGNRFATAAAISRRSHPNGADQVIIATGAAFPDALAGGPFAARRDAPLLLTNRNELPTATLTALDTLSPSSAVILGGTAAVSNQVRAQLEGRGITVSRVRGDDRFGTAAAIARRMVGSSDVHRVFIATGAGFADALSAATPAGALGSPILLTGRDRLPEATAEFLRERNVGEAVIVGGTAVVRNAVRDELQALDSSMNIRRLGGTNRYETARRVNEWAEGALPNHDGRELFVANGANFPDALAGGPFGAQRGHLLMIVPPRDALADPHAKHFIETRADELNRITLFGGRSALSLYQQWQLDQIVVR